jgi:hypothetical protein
MLFNGAEAVDPWDKRPVLPWKASETPAGTDGAALANQNP